MNPHSGMNDNNNRRTKATAAIPMAGAIVTAALLLSGLSLFTSYQPVIAQQNMTGVEGGGGATTITTDNATSAMGGAAQGGNASTTGGGGANQSTSEARMNLEQARMALQSNDTQSAMMYLDMALSAMGGGGPQGNMTSNMTSTTTDGGGATNATTSGGAEGGATPDGTSSGGGPLEGIFGGNP